MKPFVAVCIFALAPPLIAQTNPQTFTDADHTFQFKYSPSLVHCTRGSIRPGARVGWIEEPCISQGDICHNDATTGATFVCLAYPKDKLKDKPGFIAAVFFVRSVPEATTQKVCLEGSQDWLVHDFRATIVDGISAKLFHTSDAWMSGSESGEVYRVFHRNNCYELGILEANSNEAAYDPGTFKEYTARDAAEVRASLKQPLNSFTFLK
jgi:hypothetical protein